MKFLRSSFLTLIVVLYLQSASFADESVHEILYSNIQPANLSESYDRIKLIPLKHFEFVHDSVPGRRHMGLIGPDAQRHFPESVEVVPKYTIPNKDRKQPPTTLIDYPLVDKSVIFMHGLAAVQELIGLHDSLKKSVSDILESRKEYEIMIADIERRLSIEVDKQLIERKELALSELRVREKEFELESLRAIEEKEAIEGEFMAERSLLQYEEELVRRRMDHQEHLAQISMEKSLTLERDLAEKREILRRESAELLQKRKMEYRVKLEEKKKEFEMEKIKAELLANMEQEKANEDIAIRKMQAQAKLDTQRYLDLFRSVSHQIALISKDFVSDPERLAYMISACLAVLLMYYCLKELIVVIKESVQARLGRPSLVRETSVHSSLYTLLSLPLHLFSCIFGEDMTKDKKKIAEHFKDVILSEEDKARVVQLALATRNTKRTGSAFRHLLLHGPPGTGKTLVARHLAECSGMDYAILSGGDVGPLGEDSVTQLHGLFRWAGRSRRGLLLFIDEAEAFLSARGKVVMSGADDTHVRHALNALLYQTGSQSRSFMMVLATNRPEDLDPAVLDRMDVSLYIGLPAVLERQSMVRLYFESHLTRVASMTQKKLWPFARKNYVDEQCCNQSALTAVAMQCDGFSGREISKLFIACRYAMIMAEGGKLTLPLFEESVRNKIKEHRQKKGFADFNGKEMTSEKPGVESNKKKFIGKSLQAETKSGSSRSEDSSNATEKDGNGSESDSEELFSDVQEGTAARKGGPLGGKA